MRSKKKKKTFTLLDVQRILHSEGNGGEWGGIGKHVPLCGMRRWWPVIHIPFVQGGGEKERGRGEKHIFFYFLWRRGETAGCVLCGFWETLAYFATHECVRRRDALTRSRFFLRNAIYAACVATGRGRGEGEGENFRLQPRGKRIMAKVVKRGGDLFLSFFPGNCGAPSLGFFGTFTKIREIVAIAAERAEGGMGFYCRFPSPLSSDDRIFTEGENNRAIKFPLFSFFFEGDLGEKGKQKSEAISRTEKNLFTSSFLYFSIQGDWARTEWGGGKRVTGHKRFIICLLRHTLPYAERKKRP